MTDSYEIARKLARLMSHPPKPSKERLLEPLAIKLHKVNPNFITLVGSIPSLLFFVFMMYHWYIPALIIFIGNALDMLDGIVARKYHKATAFGGFLDSFIDRLADYLIITAFSFSGVVRWEISGPLLLFAYLTSYARSRGELANTSVSFALGLIQRPGRLGLIFIALLVYILVPNLHVVGLNAAEITLVITTLLSFYTVLQRFMYAYKEL